MKRRLTNEAKQKHDLCWYSSINHAVFVGVSAQIVRNALIENYHPPTIRQDTGQLWENFLMLERLKTSSYHFHYANRYFWRTQTGAELDYIEEFGGQLHGYEFKWGNTTARSPKTWNEAYPEATYACINTANFMDFVCLGRRKREDTVA